MFLKTCWNFPAYKKNKLIDIGIPFSLQINTGQHHLSITLNFYTAQYVKVLFTLVYLFYIFYIFYSLIYFFFFHIFYILHLHTKNTFYHSVHFIFMLYQETSHQKRESGGKNGNKYPRTLEPERCSYKNKSLFVFT